MKTTVNLNKTNKFFECLTFKDVSFAIRTCEDGVELAVQTQFVAACSAWRKDSIFGPAGFWWFRCGQHCLLVFPI